MDWLAAYQLPCCSKCLQWKSNQRPARTATREPPSYISVCQRHLERPGLYSYLLVFDISDSHIHILVFDATSGHFQQYLVRLTWSLVAVTGGLDLSDISNETSGWFQLCFLTKCLVFFSHVRYFWCDVGSFLTVKCNMIKPFYSHVSKPDIVMLSAVCVRKQSIFEETFSCCVFSYRTKYLSILKRCCWWH